MSRVAVRCSAEMRLEVHPYGPDSSSTPPGCSRSAMPRSARRARPAGGLRAARRGRGRDRGARNRERLGRRRNPRRRGRRLHARDAAGGSDVGAERLGRAGGPCSDIAEDVRDLYGLAAARWVDEGLTSHYAVAPADDAALIDAWFRLGFGQQHVHAIREAPETTLTRLPDGVEIRRPTRDEIPNLAELELALPAHQHASPVFSQLGPPPLEEAISEWEEDFDDPKYATFVAVLDGRVVGSAIGCSITVSGTHKGIVRPDNAGFLGFAAVCRRPAGAASAARSARRCSTGRRQRATRRSSPTGAQRTCSRHAPGRSSGIGRRFSACFRAIDVWRLPGGPWLLVGWGRGTHPPPLGLAGAARHDRRRRAPA